MSTLETSSTNATTPVKIPPPPPTVKKTTAGPAVKRPATANAVKKTPEAVKPSAAAKPKVAEVPVAYQIRPLEKKKKSDKKKVIRDSFSFPEHDHHKITELKKICLAAGVHVKKGEILRAGLGLLVDLKLSELLEAVGKVERVRTGRPKANKN